MVKVESFLGRFLRVLWAIAGWVILWLSMVIGAASLWIRQTFGPISVDQMLLHLPGAGAQEAVEVENGYIGNFILWVFVLPTLIVMVLAAVAWFIAHRKGKSSIAPRSGHILRFVRPILVFGSLVLALGVFAETVGLQQYIRSATTARTMESYYQVPDVAPSSQRNLVTIYLESIEDSLADDTVFEMNMLEPIQRATRGWDSIEELSQFSGGGWTMSGIVGTQCGVPLRGTEAAQPGRLREIGLGEELYMPGATCLGDVLSANGYQNVFMGGADPNYASKGTFLRTHGFEQVMGLQDWQEAGETEFSDWGLSDRALMEQAKRKVDELHSSGQPFNLTLLTVDTHEPTHVFDSCPVNTETEMTSVTYCSMQQVAGFLAHLESQGYLEDTAVVIMGDHTKFVSGRSEYQELLGFENRTVFNRIWSPDAISVERQSMDQLGMYATILELLGFDLADSRAGVGVSAYVGKMPGSVLDLGPDTYVEVIESRSTDLYSRLWDLPENEVVQAEFFDLYEDVPAA